MTSIRVGRCYYVLPWLKQEKDEQKDLLTDADESDGFTSAWEPRISLLFNLSSLKQEQRGHACKHAEDQNRTIILPVGLFVMDE